jgi:hypothetical protein
MTIRFEGTADTLMALTREMLDNAGYILIFRKSWSPAQPRATRSATSYASDARPTQLSRLIN